MDSGIEKHRISVLNCVTEVGAFTGTGVLFCLAPFTPRFSDNPLGFSHGLATSLPVISLRYGGELPP
jgi:hypothetical protein